MQLALPFNVATFNDPAFMENRAAPVHRWVPWIAGFSGAFVNSVLAAYLGNRKSAVVLDPFAGVGTTFIQSAIPGDGIVGFAPPLDKTATADFKTNQDRTVHLVLENWKEAETAKEIHNAESK